VLGLRSVDEIGGDGGEILAHQLERALEIFALRASRAGFAPRFLNFREVYYLSHFLLRALQKQLRLLRIEAASGNQVD